MSGLPVAGLFGFCHRVVSVYATTEHGAMERGKLLNLLEMKRVYVDKVVRLVDALAHLPAVIQGIELTEEHAKITLPGMPDADTRVNFRWTNTDLTPEVVDGGKELMEVAGEQCRELGLRVSLRQVERLERLLSGERVNMLKVGRTHSELKARITDELESCCFLKIDADKERYYEALNVFGPAVAAAYPAARYDIQEAGSCFACGRWTACVFHLMRALETPLMLLSGTFGVAFDSCGGNWNKVLDQFDKKLREVLKDNSANKKDDWRENEEFYSEASALLRNVKNAWRNSVSHAVQSYDEERARGVLNSVESIMRHLATRLAQ